MTAKTPDKTDSGNVLRPTDTLDVSKLTTGGRLEDCDTQHHTIIGWQDCISELDVPFLSQTDWIHKTKLDLFKHLDRHNNGLQNGWRTNKNYETYYLNHHLIENAADRIGLTPFERGKAVGIFTGLNLDEFGLPKEEVAVAVCGWVLNEETERKTHPNARNNYDELYQEAIEAFDCRPEQINRAFYRVGKAIEAGLTNRMGRYGPIQSMYSVPDPLAERQVAEFSSGI